MASTYPNSLVANTLTILADRCREAGAAASTVIHSQEKLVIFYKDPSAAGLCQSDLFDEVHIRLNRDACVLIAVFPND